MKITKNRILEIIKEELEEAHMDREGDMAKGQLYHTAKNAMTLFDSLKDEDQLEGWVQSKITKAADYMKSVRDYLEYEMGVEMMDPEQVEDMIDPDDVLEEGMKDLHTEIENMISEKGIIKKVRELAVEMNISPLDVVAVMGDMLVKLEEGY
tara:strand:+ start:328 stop:783 length:456 start_codon:yes stop_codon:yes gene_type:complete